MSTFEATSDSSNFALRQLRNLLDGGSFAPEQRLPPERALASQIGIGRRALRRALEVLEAEGRIWRHQGKGTFVGQRPPPAQPDWDGMSSRTNPLEVMEARLELEPGAGPARGLARLECRSRTPLAARRKDGLQFRRRRSRTLGWSVAPGDRRGRRQQLLLMIVDVVDRIRQDATWRRLREQGSLGRQPVDLCRASSPRRRRDCAARDAGGRTRHARAPRSSARRASRR